MVGHHTDVPSMNSYILRALFCWVRFKFHLAIMSSHTLTTPALIISVIKDNCIFFTFTFSVCYCLCFHSQFSGSVWQKGSWTSWNSLSAPFITVSTETDSPWRPTSCYWYLMMARCLSPTPLPSSKVLTHRHCLYFYLMLSNYLLVNY